MGQQCARMLAAKNIPRSIQEKSVRMFDNISNPRNKEGVHLCLLCLGCRNEIAAALRTGKIATCIVRKRRARRARLLFQSRKGRFCFGRFLRQQSSRNLWALGLAAVVE